MMNFMRRVRVGSNERGFSLIELMIVVAIIGILATIALPNFQKFQRKARQSEAKGTLSGIYTAQKSFAAEWEGYSGDLGVIGYAPEGQIRYDANSGPAGTYPPAYTAGGMAAMTGVNSTRNMCGTALAPDCSNTLATVGAAAGVINNAVGMQTFTANAAANLGGSQPDLWSINQQRQLQNTQSGL